MKKTLIALLTNSDDDVYCFRLELVQAFLTEGYKVLISCPDGPKFELLSKMGIHKNQEYVYDNPPIDRRGTSVINDIKLLLHYRRLFLKNRPDIILAYTAKPNTYASIVAQWLHIPVINNITGLGSVLHTKGIKKSIIMALFKVAYRKSTCIMFQNSANMKLAKERGWVTGNYRLIPGSGVALKRYSVQNYPEGGDGVDGEILVINYIGRILYDKGVDDYIEAAKIIKKRYPRTEFNMIGFIEPTEIHYEKMIESLQRQGIIFYRGSQEDIRPWIKRAHLIVHPSTYGEGMSNVLLENAASGRPIITTDNPGCKEIVAEGVSGFIYQGRNIDQLVQKLEVFVNKMTNEERKQMGLEGRKKVEKEFSRELVIKAYQEEINKALS